MAYLEQEPRGTDVDLAKVLAGVMTREIRVELMRCSD